MKLQTKNETKFGQKNIIPGAGMVEISENGEIEIADPKIAQEVEDANIGFFIVRDKKIKGEKTKEENLGNKSEEDELNKNNDNDKLGGNDDDSDELIKGLKSKTFNELKELANPFPKKEWKDMDQQALTEYLIGKLNG